MAEDFNWYFDSKLDTQGENSIRKKKALIKLIELMTYIHGE